MNWLAALLLSMQAPVQAIPINQECLKTCVIDQAGLEFIRKYEGFSPIVYNDIAGKPTVGVGHLVKPGEEFTRPLTADEADDLLASDTRQAVEGVNRRVVVRLQQHEFDALASFTFNLGEGSLAHSTLLKYINEERDDLVPAQFERWIMAGGKPSQGLIVRRKAEAILYVG